MIIWISHKNVFGIWWSSLSIILKKFLILLPRGIEKIKINIFDIIGKCLFGKNIYSLYIPKFLTFFSLRSCMTSHDEIWHHDFPFSHAAVKFNICNTLNVYHLSQLTQEIDKKSEKSKSETNHLHMTFSMLMTQRIALIWANLCGRSHAEKTGAKLF